jgi:hypothetical protein
MEEHGGSMEAAWRQHGGSMVRVVADRGKKEFEIDVRWV